MKVTNKANAKSIIPSIFLNKQHIPPASYTQLHRNEIKKTLEGKTSHQGDKETEREREREREGEGERE